MERCMFNVVMFSFLWSSLYFLLCHFLPHRSNEWHCRTVTAIHASTVTLLCSWCGFVQGPWPFTDVVGPSTPLQNVTIMICLGYFLFDLSWCLYFQTEGPAMLSHHILSIVGMTVAVVTGYYGTEMIATMFGSEITNPLLQARWFLRETGNHGTLTASMVEIAFMSMFGIFRIGIGSYLLYTYFCQDTDMWGRLGAVTIYGISWIFWISIVKYAWKKISRKFLSGSSDKNSGNKVHDRKSKQNGSHNISNNCSHDNPVYEKTISNGSVDHKLLANGNKDYSQTRAVLSNEIHRNGFTVRNGCDNTDTDGVTLRQRLTSGLVEEKLIHSTVASSQVQ